MITLPQFWLEPVANLLEEVPLPPGTMLLTGAATLEGEGAGAGARAAGAGSGFLAATGAGRAAGLGAGSPPPKAQLIEEAPPGAW